jgi:oxygen-independent coproporphyrinogen-3 oxidase
MIESICKEIICRKDYLANQVVETVYFGGGTPSLLTKDEFEQVLNSIKTTFNLSADLEFTVEANPDDINKNTLQDWKQIGVNRLSIGLQSFREEDLRWMNRAHNRSEALNCVSLAQEEGFDNLSVDLIYGLPNLSTQDWKKNIQHVIDMKVPHVSAYCLTVEEKTSLHQMVKNNKIKPASEDEQSDQFNLLIDTLAENGMEQYEISNFSKLGKHSIHNSNYWTGKHYLGIGPSAHSFNGTSRSWNISNNQQYIKKVANNEKWDEIEILSKENQFNELLMTGLRTKFGVDTKKLKKIFPFPIKFQTTLSQFIDNSWITEDGSNIRLTQEGKLKADFIASELFVL